MHIALGYRWFETSLGYHLERSLIQLGHTVTYVGLANGGRAGFDNVSVPEVLAGLSQPADLFLWVDPAGRYFPREIEQAPVPTAGYIVDVHLGTWREQAARFFDAVFIAQKDYLETYRQALGHDQVFWLPLAAAPDAHYDRQVPRIYDVGFVGNLALAHRGTARARRLKLLAEKFRTNDFYGSYTPQQVGEIYSQSRLVMNSSIAGDVTMRLFEATACGALTLTDGSRNGLNELFDIGREIVVYQNDADLLDKITYYLAHDTERQTMAQAGQKRTLAQHTYAHRMADLLAAISAPGFRRSAPLRTARPAELHSARQAVYTHLQMLDALLDDLRAAGANPIQRLWSSLPCLARRLIL
jgi:Glycosyl transferases group 1/DUF based on E. rectale Gene description (DUF3880)